MKKIAQLLIATMLVGTASAQTSFIQKIKAAFTPASSQKTAKPNPAPQPAKPATPAVAPVKPAMGPAATGKPAASKVAGGKVAIPQTTKAAGNKTAAPAIGKPVVKSSQSTASKQTQPAGTRISVAPIAPQPKQGAQKSGPFSRPKKLKSAKTVAAAKNTAKATSQAAETSASTPEDKAKKVITAEGRRDPFLSPVVNSPTGPGCSTGKRCLAIGQIIVRGVVKSEAGMIAVVVNAMNKAYFLKENDPVFNGYVVKITGDSVIFKETYQDKLGKEFTREVVKRITTPAV